MMTPPTVTQQSYEQEHIQQHTQPPHAQVIFRNVHKLLADTASSEFLFCLDFWEDEPLFRELLAPIVAVVEGDLATQLQVGFGACGVQTGTTARCSRKAEQALERA